MDLFNPFNNSTTQVPLLSFDKGEMRQRGFGNELVTQLVSSRAIRRGAYM